MISTSVWHTFTYLNSSSWQKGPRLKLASLFLALTGIFCTCANNDSATTRVNQAVTICVQSNDSSIGGQEMAYLDSNPAHGSLTIVSTFPDPTCYEYTPANGYVGTDTFAYFYYLSNERATVTITITQSNATPTVTITSTATATETAIPTATSTATATFTPVPPVSRPKPSNTPEPVCGDGVCNGGENSFTCSADCGACGNGVCDSGENHDNCATDCAAPPPGGTGPVCGDGICDPSEFLSCVADCS